MSDGAGHLLTVDDYEKAAKRLLSKLAYDYYRSGSEEERTLERNRMAFKSYEIWYRVLVDVSEVDLSTEILGTQVAFPILVAPTAFHKLAHPEGEVATARGTAEAGTLFTLSTLATAKLEDVASSSPVGPKWFQLYIHKDRGLTKSLVEKAEAVGYLAIVLTADTPILGRRLVDLRNSFALPEGVLMENLVEESIGRVEGSSELAEYVLMRQDASITWSDLDWLRSITDLPILVKGIVRADDATTALDHGASGIVVSNHGGRQMDSAPAALDALPEVLDAAEGRVPVLMDGGVRFGTDAFKALALGAKAVMVGRPVIWGLAVEGAKGVVGVLRMMRDDLVRTMALAGCPNLASIEETLIRRVGSSGSTQRRI